MQAKENLPKPCQRRKLFVWQIKADKMAKNIARVIIFAASKKQMIYECNMDSPSHPYVIDV